MRFPWSHFAASMLLIQALTGWCWHCPCACAPAAQSAADGLPANEGCKCCEHERQGTSDRHFPSAPDNGRLQCHGICVYVATEKAPIVGPDLVRASDMPALASSRLLSTGVDQAWEIAHEPLKSGPPLRLHLLHQIMLI